MKTLIVIATFVLLTLKSNSQQFYGVNISGPLPTAIEKFKQKGFVLKTTLDMGVIMKGRIVNQDVSLFIFITPKTKMVFKMVVYFDELNSFDGLYSQYDKMVSTLTQKYGEPDFVEEKFITPYELGDGYELTALEVEKCLYSTTWLYKNNLNVQVQISKYKQLKVTYENDILSDQKDKEEEMLKSNIY